MSLSVLPKKAKIFSDQTDWCDCSKSFEEFQGRLKTSKDSRKLKSILVNNTSPMAQVDDIITVNINASLYSYKLEGQLGWFFKGIKQAL